MATSDLTTAAAVHFHNAHGLSIEDHRTFLTRKRIVKKIFKVRIAEEFSRAMASQASNLWIFTMFLIFVIGTDVVLSKRLECPDKCNCYFSKTNLVTDCSFGNFWNIPFEGMDINVHTLNVNGNNLHDVQYPFPAGIELRTLHIADNFLINVENTTFSGLHHLEYIDLSNNNITTINPYAFNDTTGLTTIILKDNQLKPIEGPFLYVNTLLNLDLAYCRIRTLSPQFFFNVRNLNTLDLSGNPLDKIQSGIFDPLKSLKHLFLNNCKITYIYFDAFKDLGYLTALDLGENNLKNQVGWTIALNPLGNLQHLDVRKSNISRLDEYSFSNNDLLRSLVLTENELSDDNIDITLGKNIAKLYFLDLSYCNLRGPLFANAFDHATELHTLILSGNKLISEYLAEALFPLVKLVKLSIKDCELIMFPSNSVHNFTNLKELDISKNKLDITHLCLVDSLEHLNMGFNNLERISAKTFSKMSNLKSLVLSGNKLKKLEKGLFKNLKDLEVLELNMCEIRQLNNTIFYKDVPYPNLVELRLSGNPIQIPEEGSIFPFTMSKLNTLDMSKCNLSYLTKEFFTPTPNLKNLLLNNNTLQNDKNNIMKCMERLTCLENLDLAYNNITSITPQEFNYNIQLVSLKLAGNPWKCDCFIVDMLNWALSIKRNTTVLEGIMESNVVNNRLSEILYCNFDSHNSLIERSEPQTSKSKSFTYNYYVTIAWSVYAADSHCTPTETPIRQLRSGRGVTKEVSENQSETLEVDNETEDQLLLIMSVCAVTLVVSVTVAVIFARSREQVIIVNFPRENVEQFL